MSDYRGVERRTVLPLSDDQLDAIAEKAAAKALQKVYADVGKSAVNKFLWVVGAITIAVLLWMGSKGIKP